MATPQVTITPDPPQARTTVTRVARSTSPVTLDFSKAQPIDQPVTLDFSRAEPVTLPEGYSLEQPHTSTAYPTLPPGYSVEGQQPVTITPDNHVLMIAPGGGEAAYVPQDQVASYEAKGGKVGIRMTAPDGKQKAIVPFDQQDAYQKQGATWDVHPDNDAAKKYLQSSQKQTQFTYPAAGPGGGLYTTSLPKQKADQLEEEGRQARISGGEGAAVFAAGTLATPAVGGGLEAIASKFAPAARTVATGLVDELGNPIVRQQAVEGIGKIPGILKSAYDWANANPVKAYLLFKVADEIGLGPKGLKQIFHLAAGSGE